jgi:hypothetical protein
MTLPSRDVPPRAMAAFNDMPRAGDSVLVRDPSRSPQPDDDMWRRIAIIAPPHTAFCPLRPLGLSSSAAEAARGIALRLSAPLPPSVHVGSPVRVFATAAYSIYRSSSGDWMLGYTSCAGGSCTTRQPVSGPYLPRLSGGLVFRFYDRAGSETMDRESVRRIDVEVRARTRTVVDAGHVRREQYADSLAISIALRNHP